MFVFMYCFDSVCEEDVGCCLLSGFTSTVPTVGATVRLVTGNARSYAE